MGWIKNLNCLSFFTDTLIVLKSFFEQEYKQNENTTKICNIWTKEKNHPIFPLSFMHNFYTLRSMHLWTSVAGYWFFFCVKISHEKCEPEIIHVFYLDTLQWCFRYFQFYYNIFCCLFVLNVSTQREEDTAHDIPLGCLFIIRGKDILRKK